MLEIVFSDSACASLKLAQHYGDGEYTKGCIGVIIGHGDGRKPTRKEIKEARHEAEEKDYLDWKNAVPLGGDEKDVYGFNLALSYGDISEDVPAERRRQALERLFSLFPADGGKEIARQLLDFSNRNLEAVLTRAAEGEPIRIWYSYKPDELCGLYWFMARLSQPGFRHGPVYLVEQPQWGYGDNENIIRKNGWGDVAPGEWHRYVATQQMALPAFCKSCAGDWARLQTENAPLRAVLNGRLISAPAVVYDDLIKREIAGMPSQFLQAEVIGRVLGHGLGIGDALVAIRMEEMVRSGYLQVVEAVPADEPIYHRVLKICSVCERNR